MPTIRKPYDREPVSIGNFSPSRTKQQFKEECDINNILQAVRRTGVLEHQARASGRFEDVTTSPLDYHQAFNQVIAAQETFMELPATVRRRFGNDPGEFFAFAHDPDNEDELIKLGLASPRRPPPAPEPPGDDNAGGEGGTPPSQASGA